MKAPSQFSPRPGEVYIHTAIRGLAALSVVGYHAMLGSVGKGYADDIIYNFFLTSFLFVDFFFILSGYIMTESYKDKITSPRWKASAIEFLIKRGQKILPNYYIWLLISIFLSISISSFFGSEPIGISCASRAVAAHLFLVQNLIGACYYFNTPLWSIAVEFLAYLVFPILIGINARPAVLIVAGVGFYFLIFSLSPTIDLINGGFSVMRCFAGFICGMGAAKITHRSYPDYIQISLFIALFLSISYNFQTLALLLMWATTFATASNLGVLSHISRSKYPHRARIILNLSSTHPCFYGFEPHSLQGGGRNWHSVRK